MQWLKGKYQLCIDISYFYRDAVNMAKRVKKDFQSGKITNLHPPYVNTKKRKYHASSVDNVAVDFWIKDATIPEPSYTKVTQLFYIGHPIQSKGEVTFIFSCSSC